MAKAQTIKIAGMCLILFADFLASYLPYPVYGENMFYFYNCGYGGHVTGEMLFQGKSIIPSCGWRATLESSEVIQHVTLYKDRFETTTEDISVKQTSNHTFELTSKNTSHSLSQWEEDGVGLWVYIGGAFRCSDPEIWKAVTIFYTCLCTSTTFPPHNPCEEEEDNDVYKGQNITDSTKMLSRRASDVCYTGNLVTSVSYPRHGMVCHIKCVPDQSCVGINKWQDGSRCDLVMDQNFDDNLETVFGCQFYRVLWKN